MWEKRWQVLWKYSYSTFIWVHREWGLLYLAHNALKVILVLYAAGGASVQERQPADIAQGSGQRGERWASHGLLENRQTNDSEWLVTFVMFLYQTFVTDRLNSFSQNFLDSDLCLFIIVEDQLKYVWIEKVALSYQSHVCPLENRQIVCLYFSFIAYFETNLFSFASDCVLKMFPVSRPHKRWSSSACPE